LHSLQADTVYLGATTITKLAHSIRAKNDVFEDARVRLSLLSAVAGQQITVKGRIANVDLLSVFLGSYINMIGALNLTVGSTIGVWSSAAHDAQLLVCGTKSVAVHLYLNAAPSHLLCILGHRK
jgi:hypothetical protein